MTGAGSSAAKAGASHGRPVDKRAIAFSGALSAILFVSLVASIWTRDLVDASYLQYAQPFTSWLPESSIASIAIMAAFSIALGIGFYLLLSRLPRVHSALGRMRPPKQMPLDFTACGIVRAAFAIFALWLPIIAIMYPTGLTADTLNQLYQFQATGSTFYPTLGTTVNAEFIDHHPVFDTLLYGAFWQIGYSLGSQNAGLFMLVVLQSVTLAAELGALTCYLERLDVPYPLRAATLVFFAWFPFFGHYAATVLKDTTYLTAFIPWMIMWVETARTRGKALEDARFLAAFMVLGGFCIITKKLGVFVFAASLAVLVGAMRGQRARVLASGLAAIAVFYVIAPAVVYPAIGGVAPGGKQEALGPAIQQVTALAREDSNALSEADKNTVNKVFDLKRAAKRYTPFRSDAAKSTYRPDATNADILAFLRVWLAAGVRHPDVYLKSTVETTGMLYIPYLKTTYYSGEDLSSRQANYLSRNPGYAVSISQPESLVELNDYLEFDSIESKISNLPIVSLLFTEGFFGSWIPLISIGLTLFARRRLPGADARSESAGTGAKSEKPFYLIALAPLIISALFLLVSPVASPRYILPLMYCTPLMLGWAWHVNARREASRR